MKDTEDLYDYITEYYISYCQYSNYAITDADDTALEIFHSDYW
eukprot:CAMPEP_0201285994 /NCGR_PEP_ID=MMETSP1317-20130820/114132_1 /ASSEMBLY_ACC=CAM_ASM_000770 /TAXON_ID=187299 /ORGANISM="Undescribed Undescribed, Strain Undescribed" /LENGTH=42 /DNA_ID= /DNA_START= /DNA_END= /DNA_ORIENTATION=